MALVVVEISPDQMIPGSNTRPGRLSRLSKIIAQAFLIKLRVSAKTFPSTCQTICLLRSYPTRLAFASDDILSLALEVAQQATSLQPILHGGRRFASTRVQHYDREHFRLLQFYC